MNNGNCLTCYIGYILRNGQCYKTLIIQQTTSGLQQASATDSSQGSSSQQTTVTSQGSADLQFGVLTVPVDNGTIVTNTITGSVPSVANITGATSGPVVSNITTTTTSTSTTTGTTGDVSLTNQSLGVVPTVSGGFAPSSSQTTTTTETLVHLTALVLYRDPLLT
jgi:hypothetical protein